MTLRLALVIDGDPSGAKKALEDVGKGVDTLKKDAEGAAEPVGKIGDSLAEAAEKAPEAAKGIDQVGTAAVTNAGKIGSFRSALLDVGVGLIAGIGIAAAGELFAEAAGKVGAYFQEIFSNIPQAERDLKAHKDLIGQIKGAFNEAQGAASSYGLNATAVLRFQAQQNVARLQNDLKAATAEIPAGPLGAGGTSPDEFGALTDMVAQFRRDLAAGKANVISFREELAKAASELRAGSGVRAQVEVMLEETQRAAELQAELARAKDLLKGIEGDANAAATALGGSAEKYRELGPAAASANDDLAETDRLLKSIAGASGAPAAVLTGSSGLPAGSFASGGWTGDAPIGTITGFVHGKEYVFDAAATARIGVGNLDAIRMGALRGYADGGYVGYAGPWGSGMAVAGSIGTVDGLIADLSVLRGSLSEFGRTLLETRSGLAALGSVALSVSQRYLDMALGALDKAAFGSGSGGSGLVGSWLGSIFSPASVFPAAPAVSAGLYHGGGEVGPFAASVRMVPPSVFFGAPRLHSGGWLQPGERPVIAKDGEVIDWPENLARQYGGGTVVNNWNIQTPSPRAFAESKATLGRTAGRLAARSGRYT